jgi:hypothetical protein
MGKRGDTDRVERERERERKEKKFISYLLSHPRWCHGVMHTNDTIMSESQTPYISSCQKTYYFRHKLWCIHAPCINIPDCLAWQIGSAFYNWQIGSAL